MSYEGKKLYHGAFSQLFSVHSADSVRDLNNYLQGHPCGNLSSQLYWVTRIHNGPRHYATAICKSINHTT